MATTAGVRGYAYDPGYLRTDKLVSVETNVYQVADEKLIWPAAARPPAPNRWTISLTVS
jgi:hypothetical protein